MLPATGERKLGGVGGRVGNALDQGQHTSGAPAERQLFRTRQQPGCAPECELQPNQVTKDLFGNEGRQQVGDALRTELQTGNAPAFARFSNCEQQVTLEPRGESGDHALIKEGLAWDLPVLTSGIGRLEGQRSGYSSLDGCLQVVEEWGKTKEEVPGNFESRELQVSFGLVYGPEGRLKVGCCAEPGLTRYLNNVIARNCGSFVWTTLVLARNPEGLGPFREMADERFPCCMFTLGRFQGGGIWAQSLTGEGPVVREVCGSARVGHVFDAKTGPLILEPTQAFAVDPWMGGDLWLVKAFVTQGYQGCSETEKEGLLEYGFRFGAWSAEWNSIGAQGFEVCLGNWSGKNNGGPEEEWEILYPHQVATPELVEAAVGWHESAMQRCRMLSLEALSETPGGSDLTAVLRDWKIAQGERDWLEVFLEYAQPIEEVSPVVKSLVSDIPIGESAPVAVEQLLQTRTVGLDEARREMDSWVEPAKDEIRALEVTTQAVERITSKEVELLIQKGTKVAGKVVLTRKSGIGKRRLRAVCCGNFIPPSELNTTKAELYAGGIDALTVRVVLAFVSQFSSWCGCAVDVKTAFLNAPVRGSSPEDDGSTPVIIVKPPFFLTQLGLMEPTHRWRVKKALYGLQTSPRDWSEHRDKVLRGLVVREAGHATLHQSITDTSLWHVKSLDGSLIAVMIVYVDDIAAFGPQSVIAALIQSIKEYWTLSEPSWSLGGNQVMFCGMELVQHAWGWRISQVRYMTELLNRYGIEGTASSPMPKVEEPEVEDLPAGLVKEAQAITGAILWATTRSTPDLMFVTNCMSRWATKAPRRVKEWGLQALKYASSTIQLGLEFRCNPGPPFGVQDQLAAPRNHLTLEVYTDASHAPGGNRSIQSTVLLWRGCTVLWECSRQPFVTLSSAEAELVGVRHAVQISEGVAPVVEELLSEDLTTSILADNAAAISAFHPTGGNWRNRHLRMRAQTGRERIELGSLTVSYIPGELQVADIGTKPLGVARLLGLLELVNVRLPEKEEAGPVAAKFFGRLCTKTAQTAFEMSPATVLALALVTSPVQVEALLSVRTLSAVLGVSIARAQPDRVSWDLWSLFWWFLGCCCFLLLGLMGVWIVWLRLGMQDASFELESSRVEVTSPRRRREPASSSHEVGSQVSMRQPPLNPISGTGRSRWNRRGDGVGGMQDEVCALPIVGRIDPRANWVPSHFLRYLLSAVGTLIVEAVGLEAREVWLLREVGRTFRYGVASAYEAAVRRANSRELERDQGVEGGEELVEEEGRDQVRHVDPHLDLGPHPQDIPMQYEPDSDDQLLSDVESSTEASGRNEGEAALSGESEIDEPGEGQMASGAPEPGSPSTDPGGVRYRAEDEALIVVHADDELRIPLVGWSLEEVVSIVRSIQEGDWSFFHEVMAFQGNSEIGVQTRPVARDSSMMAVPPNGIFIGPLEDDSIRDGLLEGDAMNYPEGALSAMGSEGDSDLPLLEELPDLPDVDDLPLPWEQEWAPTVLAAFVDWIGVPCWVVGVCCLVWGIVDLVSRCGRWGAILLYDLESGSENSVRGTGAGGLLSVPERGALLGLHLGWVVTGVWVVSGIQRVGVVLLGLVRNPDCVVLELPVSGNVAVIPCFRDPRWVIWIVLVILFGLVHPAESQIVDQDRSSSFDVPEGKSVVVARPAGREFCPAPNALADVKGSGWIMLIVFAAATISVWETFKCVSCRTRFRRKTAESQTEGMNIVPLPLASGVPFRAQILFSRQPYRRSFML